MLLPSTNIIHYYIMGLRLLDPNWLENGKPPFTCKYLPSPAFWTHRPVRFGDQLWAEMPHEECQEQIRESGIWTESLVFTGCLLKQGFIMFIYLFAPKARSLELKFNSSIRSAGERPKYCTYKIWPHWGVQHWCCVSNLRIFKLQYHSGLKWDAETGMASARTMGTHVEWILYKYTQGSRPLSYLSCNVLQKPNISLKLRHRGRCLTGACGKR